MKLFMPNTVVFEPAALKYPLGEEIYKYFLDKNVEIIKSSAQSITKNLNTSNDREKYAKSKKNLLVTVTKGLKLDVCKPSADYQFSIIGNCPGSCEYCYLQTHQNYKPYLKIFVNLDDIFENIKHYINDNNNQLTTFEVASNGDPLALEHITGSLAKTIEFFSTLENGRLRVVTKFNNVDSLISLDHKKHTRFRFSLNSDYVINNFEHNTSSLDERMEAASKIADSGYPLGFIIAPIMVYENWKEEYTLLFDNLKSKLSTINQSQPLSFELIQHRFTTTAKEKILNRFPNTKLDLDEEKRLLKWGKFGKFKYVYPKEVSGEIKEFISKLIKERFPDSVIEYFT